MQWAVCGQVLGCGAAAHEAAVQRLQGRRRDDAKALKAACSELASFLGRQAVCDLPRGGHPALPFTQ